MADKKTDNTVTDDTAPGEGPVVISATEARASEPVLASEEALTKDTPPPATAPRDRAKGGPARADGDTLVRERAKDHDADAPTSGDGDYVGDPNAPTAEPGEAEFNEDARVPAPDATNVEGVSYSEVADPKDPTERYIKRELELGAEMDYSEHRRTYAMFTEVTKWGTVVIAALLFAMAAGFFTNVGLFGAIILFLGAIAGGIFFMKT